MTKKLSSLQLGGEYIGYILFFHSSRFQPVQDALTAQHIHEVETNYKHIYDNIRVDRTCIIKCKLKR